MTAFLILYSVRASLLNYPPCMLWTGCFILNGIVNDLIMSAVLWINLTGSLIQFLFLFSVIHLWSVWVGKGFPVWISLRSTNGEMNIPWVQWWRIPFHHFERHCSISVFTQIYILNSLPMYSEENNKNFWTNSNATLHYSVPNKRTGPNKSTGPNKRTGWNFDKNKMSIQGGILIKILEYRVKTSNFIDNKKDFWKYT